MVVEDYLNIGLMSKIYENYREMNLKMQTFDFLCDDLFSGKFLEIRRYAEVLDKLTDEIDFENKERIKKQKEGTTNIANKDKTEEGTAEGAEAKENTINIEIPPMNTPGLSRVTDMEI